MAFASDTFSGTGGTELSAYSGVWSKQSGFSQDALIGVDGQWMISPASGSFAAYQHSSSPANADYSVFVDVTKLTAGTPDAGGVCGRMQSGAGTFYALLQRPALGELRMYKWVSGTATQLGSSYTNAPATSVTQRLELRMAGDQISGYVDGVLRIGPVTDTAITTAGKAGIMGRDTRETGIADTLSIDNWEAVDSGGGGGGGLAPPVMRRGGTPNVLLTRF